MPAATVTQSSNSDAKLKQQIVNASSPATIVNTTLDATFDVSGLTRISVQLVVAVAALTGFAIKAKPTPEAGDSTLYSTTAEFTAPKGVLVGTSGDLSTQAIGTGWFIMDVTGLDSVTLTATSAGTATLAVQMGGA